MINVTLCKKEPLNVIMGQSVITITKEEQEKFVNPSTENITVLPDLGKVLGKVEVGAVTSNIDKNIVSRNIRAGISILGVDGDLEPDKPDQEKTIIPTKERQEVTADKGYELAKTIVEPIPDNFIEPTGVFEIEENGEYDITEYKTLVSNVPAREDLDAELNEQDELIAELDGKIDELPDREIDLSEATATADDVFEGKVAFGQEGKIVGTYKDMLQRRVDNKKSCQDLFSYMTLEDMSWTEKLDTSNATSMYNMFTNCKNVKTLDISKYNTSNVTTMYSMFMQSQNLETVNVSNIDTSNVTRMDRLFYNCTALANIIGLNTWDTSSVINMENMFNRTNTTELDLSSFTTTNVTNMYAMFEYCKVLTYIDMSNFDTSNVTNMNSMFRNCEKLKTIVGTLDLINATNVTNMMYGCRVLEDVTIKNIKLSFTFGWCFALSDNTLINAIKELWDLNGSTSQTLTLDSTMKTKIANIYVKLIEATDEMRAEDPYIDNKKPCVVCESTDEGAMTLTEYAILKNWAIS